MSYYMKISLASSSILLCVLLSACGQKPQQQLPAGNFSFTGSLVQAELSLSRRGTHILRQDGHDAYYVESTKVNLRDFQGMDVVVTGHLEQNTDPTAQPVIVADTVLLVQVPSRTWVIESLNMTFNAPLQWNGTVFTDGLSFSETGSSVSILKMYKASIAQLPTGTPLIVGGQGAVKVDIASGEVIYVQNGGAIIAIQATPSLTVSTSVERQDFERVLQSISFSGGSSSSFGSGAMIPTGSGSLNGNACGGVAGILCPAGSYCEITDRGTGVGVCTPLAPSSL